MSFHEDVERIRAVRQRIQEKKYPMPNIILPSNWDRDNFDAYRLPGALRQYEEYEKRMDQQAEQTIAHERLLKRYKRKTLSHQEKLEQLRAVQKRIEEKKYPKPNILLPSNLSPSQASDALEKYVEYEERMDDQAASEKYGKTRKWK